MLGKRIRRRSALVALLLLSGPFAMLPAPASAAGNQGWGEPFLLETLDLGAADGPIVKFDPQGNAFAVWSQSNGTQRDMWANRYVVGYGWGGAQRLESVVGNLTFRDVVVDENGNAMVTWTEHMGLHTDFWGCRFVAGAGWGPATLIYANASGHVHGPAVATDSGGNTLAVWSVEGLVSGASLWWSRFVPGAGWNQSALLSAGPSAYFPAISFDASGNAWALWQQWDGAKTSIFASEYVAGVGWSAFAAVDNQTAGSGENPRIAVQANGEVWAIWHQGDQGIYRVGWNRYVPGSGWGTAEWVETTAGHDAIYPQMVVDGQGNAIAMWSKHDGTRWNVVADRYSAGQGWGTPNLLETNNGDAPPYGVLAGDTRGAAVALWRQLNGTREDLWTNRFSPATGWGTAELVETNDAGFARPGGVAIDADGNVLAVWEQSNGTRSDIWASSIGETDPPALSLTSPRDGLTTNQSTVWVEGLTEPGARLSVNGVEVTVAANGSFGFWLTLGEGANLVNATAWDRAGNHASAFANVTFVDPTAALAASLAEAQAALLSAQANLTATQAALAATEAALAATQADLAAAQADLETHEAALAQLSAQANVTQANLEAAQADIARLEADENATAEELASARGNLSDAEAHVALVEEQMTAADAESAAARANLTAAQTAVARLEANATDARAQYNETKRALDAATLELAQVSSRVSDLEESRNATQMQTLPADNTLGILALVVGAGGFTFGAVALARRRRPE